MSSSRAREETLSAITVAQRATSRAIECAKRGAGNVLNAMFLDTLLFAVPMGKEKIRTAQGRIQPTNLTLSPEVGPHLKRVLSKMF